MTQDQLFSLLSAHGITCRIRRGEVQVRDCVFCGNSNWNLELNADVGVYHCWNCREGGRVDSFLRQFTGEDVDDIPVQKRERSERPSGTGGEGDKMLPAWDVPSARRYLESRRIDEPDTQRYEITVSADGEWRGRLVIRVRDYWTRKPAGRVARRYLGTNGKRYLSSVRPTIVGWPARDAPAVVVVEGPFDGIRAHQGGLSAAVLLGTGSNPVIDEWAGRVRPGTPVRVMMDGEAQDRADELVRRIGTIADDVAAVRLPGSLDPGDLDRRVLRTLVERTVP